jgi:hypothetical protein
VSSCVQRREQPAGKEIADKRFRRRVARTAAPITIRGGGDPRQAWLARRLREWACRLGALPPMRMTASWSRSTRTCRIQVCSAIFRARWRAPLGSSGTELWPTPRPDTETRHREKTQCASSGLTTNAPYKPAPGTEQGSSRTRSRWRSATSQKSTRAAPRSPPTSRSAPPARAPQPRARQGFWSRAQLGRVVNYYKSARKTSRR